MKVDTIARDDTARFLTAVLEGEQTELGQRRRFGMAKDPEYAAFFFEFIECEIHPGKLRRRSFQTAEVLFYSPDNRTASYELDLIRG